MNEVPPVGQALDERLHLFISQSGCCLSPGERQLCVDTDLSQNTGFYFSCIAHCHHFPTERLASQTLIIYM